MKSVLKESEQIHYVSDADMIEFISQNAPMEWNECCDFVRKHHIISRDGNQIYWKREDLVEKENYESEQFIWIKAFFDAHPWIERMMVVFDE